MSEKKIFQFFLEVHKHWFIHAIFLTITNVGDKNIFPSHRNVEFLKNQDKTITNLKKIISTLPHCRSDLSILINIAATELP